jgi:hypothetical protein
MTGAMIATAAMARVMDRATGRTTKTATVPGIRVETALKYPRRGRESRPSSCALTDNALSRIYNWSPLKAGAPTLNAILARTDEVIE